MTSPEEISQKLLESQIGHIGELIRGDLGPNHFFAHIAVKRDSENRQIPSNRILSELKEEFFKNGVNIEFLLQDSLGGDIEAGIRATLLNGFGDSVRNVFLSISGNSSDIWIEQKKTLENGVIEEIRKLSNQFLKQFGVSEISVNITSGQNTPGVLACLRTIKQHAPANVDFLYKEFVNQGFSIPSTNWLNRRLDVMRKEGRIVRREDGTYVLSLLSLQRLGASTGRNSPDIKRLLALSHWKR